MVAGAPQKGDEDMPKFPKDKAAKLALYTAIKNGITANPAEFPSGAGQPFDLVPYNAQLTSTNTAISNRQNEEGQFRLAVTSENDEIADMDFLARKYIDLAMATHGANSPKMTLIGWAPTDAPDSNIPGQPRNLEAITQLPTSCFLDWKAPAPGGAVGGGIGVPGAPPGSVSAYKVLARKRTLGGQQTQDWTLTATVIESEVTLTNLERGVEYDFEVVATNPTGDSIPSNVVTVVL